MIGDAAHATSPHAGQGASLALEDGRCGFGRLMLDGQEPRADLPEFYERRPRAEKIVVVARRNGNSKREFSPTGARIRDLDDCRCRRASSARDGLDKTPPDPRRRRADCRVAKAHQRCVTTTAIALSRWARFALPTYGLGRLFLHRERQPCMVDQALDQLVPHMCRSRRPDPGWNVRRVLQQANRAFREIIFEVEP